MLISGLPYAKEIIDESFVEDCIWIIFWKEDLCLYGRQNIQPYKFISQSAS